ncbi:hypothetical protein ON010_g10823 [Phytophthora cinnamomi]|nr:hypothetical protein ON010_g10823 [Phytophthora cinnamomi]
MPCCLTPSTRHNPTLVFPCCQVTFEWRRDEFPSRNLPAGVFPGFIADEVEEVLPDLVHEDGDGWKSLNYVGVVPHLVRAVQEMQEQLEASQAQMARMQQQIDALQAAAAATVLEAADFGPQFLFVNRSHDEQRRRATAAVAGVGRGAGGVRLLLQQAGGSPPPEESRSTATGGCTAQESAGTRVAALGTVGGAVRHGVRRGWRPVLRSSNDSPVHPSTVYSVRLEVDPFVDPQLSAAEIIGYDESDVCEIDADSTSRVLVDTFQQPQRTQTVSVALASTGFWKRDQMVWCGRKGSVDGPTSHAPTHEGKGDPVKFMCRI